MSWITILWSMMAAACLTLALVHLSIWLKQPAQYSHLLFATTAIAVTSIAAFEVLMMRAETIEEFGTAQRWVHVPAFVGVVAIVWFVRAFLGAGRLWLAYTVCALRLLSLIVNFSLDVNLNYREITGLRQLELWGGEIITVADGVFNPWTRLGQLSLLLLFVYLVDASLATWRRGDHDARRRAAVVGGSLAVFILVAGVHYGLVLERVITPPYLIAPSFLIMVVAMGYELGSDVFKSAQLGQQLQASEAQLRGSAERLRLALKGARLALWDWDIANGKVYLSDRWQEMLGGAAEPVITTLPQLAGLVHADDLPVLDRHLREALKGEAPEYEVDHRVRTLSGNWLWIHSRGEVVSRDASGRALRMTGVNEDITARKRMAEQLHESEQRMELATSAAGIGVWAWDILRNEVWVSTQGRMLLGWTETEPVNFERFLAALHPDDRERTRRAVEQSLVGRGDYEIEFRAVLRNGARRWISARGQTEFNGEGKAVRMRGVALDVTARKQAEMELAEQRNELAHLSRVAMLGELSGSLAHELNQPLAAILSNAQAAQRFLAQGAEDVDEVREILKDIVEDDKRAGEVIRRLRVLLKKDEVQPHESLDINELVLDVLRLMRSDLLNKNVTVRTHLAPDLPLVSGDRIQLQQVLLNLVMNGCDAMDDGTLDRSLAVRTELAGADNIEISVADRGRGIPAEDLERVFEPFITTKAHGMGLGLAVCRTIVTVHAGRIWAANNVGGGATFYFALPAKPAEQA